MAAIFSPESSTDSSHTIPKTFSFNSFATLLKSVKVFVGIMKCKHLYSKVSLCDLQRIRKGNCMMQEVQSPDKTDKTNEKSVWAREYHL